MEYGVLFVVLGAFGAFFMSFNNGANDVANAFASAVGSKALKMKTAVLIASFVTFTGALLLGGNVASKLVSGLVPPNSFDNPQVYVIAMITVLIASGIFVLISTLTSLPVSSSQAIVGSLTGISVMLLGWHSIQWGVILTILMGWIISPLLAAALSFGLCRLIENVLIGNRKGILLRVKRWLPVIVAVTICGGIYALFTITNLKHTIGIDAGKEFAAMGEAHILGNQKLQLNSIEENATKIVDAARHAQASLALAKEQLVERHSREILELSSQINNDARQVHIYAVGKEPAVVYATRWQVLIFVMILFFPVYFQFRTLIDNWLKDADDDSQGAQNAFKNLQIGTSCYVAFAIGSNDVANSISPLLAIYLVVQAGAIPQSFGAAIPIWILVLGGAGMSVGISVLGYRVMSTLGEKLTEINNTRGFCIDFSVATSVVGASAFGLPVSTTHAATGAVVGSGLSRGRQNVRFAMLGKILIGWLVTIPLSALITFILFSTIRWIFL